MASGDHHNSCDPEEFLGSGHVLRGYKQDSLGRFNQVALQWPPDLEILEVCKYVPKNTTRPCVIGIPRLGYARVCILGILDEREDTYDILNHIQGVPLGHNLLAMNEVT